MSVRLYVRAIFRRLVACVHLRVIVTQRYGKKKPDTCRVAQHRAREILMR